MLTMARSNLHTLHVHCQVELHRRGKSGSARKLYGEPADRAGCEPQNRAGLRLDMSTVTRNRQREKCRGSPRSLLLRSSACSVTFHWLFVHGAGGMRTVARSNLHTLHANCRVELHRRGKCSSARRLYGEPAGVAGCEPQNRV